MTMPTLRFPRVIAAMVALATAAQLPAPALAAIKDAAAYAENAQEALEEGDLRTALIELKRAAKESPDDPDIRFALGQVEVRLGDYVSAELNFRAAESAGLSDAKTRPMIAWTLLYQQKYQTLLDDIRPCPNDAACQASVLSLRARAEVMLKNMAEADRESVAALAAQPDNATAMTTRALVLMLGGDRVGAERIVDQVLATDPYDVEALSVKGDLRRADGAFQAAERFYDEAINRSPGHLYARIQLATILVAQNKLDEATDEIDQTLAIAPDSVAANYIKAFLQARTGEMAAALGTMRSVEASLSETPQGLFLLALVNLANNNIESGYQYANRLHTAQPGDLTGTKLLANAALRLKNYAQVVSLLEPRRADLAGDVGSLSALGTAYLALGETLDAQDVLQEALQQDPNADSVRSQLALLNAAQGRVSWNNVEDLEERARQNPADVGLAQALITTLYGQGQYERADEVATRLIEHQSADPRGYTLRGTVRRMLGNEAGARADLTEALRQDPSFVPAAINMAALDLQAGQFQAARDLMGRVLAENPSDLAALLARARVETQSGHAADAIPFLERAVADHPRSLKARASLLTLMVALDPDRAARMARDLADTQADDPTAISLAVQTLFQVDDVNAAVDVLKRLEDNFPDRIGIHLSAAQTFFRLGRMEDAAQAYERAIAVDASAIRAWAGRAETALSAKGLAAAQAIVARAETHLADPGIARLLRGDLLVRSGRPAEALQIYQSVQAKQPSPDAIGRVYQTLALMNQRPQAQRMMDDWLSEHPDDLRNAMLLATDLLRTGEAAAAVRRYEALKETLPRDPALFNNLAMAYDHLSDPRALDAAKRAFSLAPAVPSIVDTYGYLLYRSGDVVKGAALLKQAHAAEPMNPSIAFHYALTLHDRGLPGEARAILKPIVEENVAFDDAAEAQALYARLGGGNP